jgi:alpha-beta hydrolase superfamily lysophospholipase
VKSFTRTDQVGNETSKNRLVKYIAIGLGGLAFVYATASAFGAKVAMEVPRLPVKGSPEDVGLKYEDAAFQSRDGAVLLRGWFLPGTGGRAILVVHGGFENRVDDNVDTLPLTRDLVAKGYSVLVFDLRGRGESEGKGLTLSSIEPDIGGAMDYLEGRGFPPEKVCIMGFCSGAASVCIYASRNRAGAVVLDGCFTDVPTMMVREAESVRIPGFLARLFVPGIRVMSRLFYGYRELNPIDVVKDVACPALFIHEEYDIFIDWEETLRLYEASANPAGETWEVKGALHSQAYRIDPAQFVERVDAFISKHIKQA